MTHMRYKRRFRLLFLSLSLSRLFLFRLSLFFFLFQIPLYVSRTGAHANSRIFPFLSLPSRHPRPAPRYSVLLTYARVHIYMCTHARSRDRRGTLSVSSSLSRARARGRIPARISLRLLRNRTIPPHPVLPRLPSASRRTRSFNRAMPRRGGESLVMAS